MEISLFLCSLWMFALCPAAAPLALRCGLTACMRFSPRASCALSGIAALAVPTGIITAGLTERLDREVKVDHELARQRKVDEAHDDELARRRERDAEHDRLLREQAELLQSISEKLEQVERRVSAPKS